MVSYEPVPLPVCEPGVRDDGLIAGIEQWVTAAPLRDLVAEFGGEPPAGDIATVLAWLDDFSAAHWDFRKNQAERHRVVAPSFPPARTELVERVADALGLRRATAAPRVEYDYALVLGGLARACFQRTEFAAQQLARGIVEAGEVAGLGTFRRLDAAEQELLVQLGATRDHYEVDAMEAGVRRAFGLATPVRERSSGDEGTAMSWLLRTYQWSHRTGIHVLAAPSSDPDNRRANTADTYDFWAQQVRLTDRDRVLVVTTPIYVPFQHCDAIRALGVRYGCGVDTIGFDQRTFDEPLLNESFRTDHYLQEIRSAIRSMRSLLAALEQVGHAPG